jgi:hypothetical protein
VRLCGVNFSHESTRQAFCPEARAVFHQQGSEVSIDQLTVQRVGFVILIDKNLGTAGEAGFVAQGIIP